jgi:diguanylate cyclase (GGDEF)-like protein
VLQGASFATVGYLIATLRAGLLRERGLSRTDPLTGLLNGRAFHEEAALVLALCRRKGRPVTLAYLDLDNFKVVNDTLGHQAGDDLLRKVALLLRASTRPSDLCTRLGGDEFAVLLSDADSREAQVALERFRSVLSETTALDRCPVTVSIGAVTFLTVPESLETMLSEADSRMYVAKGEGRNRLRLEVLGGAVG